MWPTEAESAIHGSPVTEASAMIGAPSTPYNTGRVVGQRGDAGSRQGRSLPGR